jgi:serine/threonine protein kinase, bacterial
MPLGTGSEFAGYKIVRLLGSGGMGEVYLAQHPRLPRRDAVKVLPAEFAADPDYRARFEREADLASTLWHPHIVGVHDRGQTSGHLWLAMDFVDGLDAAQLLAQRHPAGLSVEIVVRIITSVASALDYAHKQALLHRDVKPANIMLSSGEGPDQRILLTDFGIARSLGEISGLTVTNMTLGTLAFSSPEQLMGDHIDGRADKYSLAATAYYLLTGAQLFPHTNPAAVIGRHLNVEPPLLSTSKPALAELDPVLARALAKKPEDRFTSCSEFAEALNAAGRATGNQTAAALAVTKPRAAANAGNGAPMARSAGGEPAGKPRPWLRPLALATGVLTVVVLVVVLVARSHQQASTAAGSPSLTTPSTPITVAPSSTSMAAALPPPRAVVGRYAIPACYSIESPPEERPASVVFEYCGDGGAELDHMTWSAWGPDGADGQGHFAVRSCQPNCAQGGMPKFPAIIHAANPVALPKDSGCPTDMKFYTDITLAFPTSNPDGLNGQTINTHYQGYPAIAYTTEPIRPSTMQLTTPSCW